MPLEQAGIFRPRPLGRDDAAVVIVSSIDGPYNDRSDLQSGYFEYRYQGGAADKDNWYNRSLRFAFEQRKPVLYLFGVGASGGGAREYVPLYPCYVTNDNRSNGFFNIVVGDRTIISSTVRDDATTVAIRAYSTVLAKRRLHHEAFRSIVLKAYHDTCAVCRLRIRTLFDAAHIIPDGEPSGDPIVQNGLTLCKIHHQAYDLNIIGITRDHRVIVSSETLEIADGPMLDHGLKKVHETSLIVPSKKNLQPDRERLNVRWEQFMSRRQ